MFKEFFLCALCFGINSIDWFITKKECVYNGRGVMKKSLFRGWKPVILPEPSCYMITYVYNSRRYTYVTDDLNCEWPPPPVEGASFVLPIKQAIEQSGKDITQLIKRFAGPRGDFHGKRITVSQILGDTTIEIENIMGQKRTLGPSDVLCLGC